MHNTEKNTATLHRLRGLGVRISMDDFGTGYSSLSYLRKFPFDKIKIDRSFISGLPDDADSIAIVLAVAGLAANLNMTATAEGVETTEQLEKVRALGASRCRAICSAGRCRSQRSCPCSTGSGTSSPKSHNYC
jgi:EAL domain-containing protein (putative c-di-GMP-specific phosphodiesterase class I)